MDTAAIRQHPNHTLLHEVLRQVSTIPQPRLLTLSLHDPNYTRTKALHQLFAEANIRYIHSSATGRWLPVRWIYLVWCVILLRKQYDGIFIHFRAYLLTSTIFPLARLLGKFIISDHFVSLYDTLCCERKTVRAGSILSDFLHFFDKFLIKKADISLVDTPEHADYFRSEFLQGKHPEKVGYIYVGCDTQHFRPVPAQEWTYQLAVPADHAIVFWYGNVLPLKGVSVILAAIDRLKPTDQVHVVLGGRIALHYPTWVGGDKVTLLPRIAYDDLPSMISQSTLCLGGHFSSIPKASRVVAGKTYQFLACGKPVIVGDLPANRALLGNCQQVTFVPVDDPEALCEQMRVLSRQYI